MVMNRTNVCRAHDHAPPPTEVLNFKLLIFSSRLRIGSTPALFEFYKALLNELNEVRVADLEMVCLHDRSVHSFIKYLIAHSLLERAAAVGDKHPTALLR